MSTITQAWHVGIGGVQRGKSIRSKALHLNSKVSVIVAEPQLTAPQMRWTVPGSRLIRAQSRLLSQNAGSLDRPAPQPGGIWRRPSEWQNSAFADYKFAAQWFTIRRLRVRSSCVGMVADTVSGDALETRAMPSSINLVDQARHLATDAKLLHQTFAELELRPVQEVVGSVRTRQHVNPLKASLMAPPAPVDWNSVLSDSSLPLMVDIGCGSGRLLMVLAKRNHGKQNYLGLDVRDRLVNRANLWAEELSLNHSVRFLTANATVAFRALLATYPGPLELVSVLCPDPHFKRRHQKRKIIQRQLVDAILDRLKSPGGQIFMQSDVKDVAVDMREQFDVHLGGLLELGGAELGVERDSEGWVIGNPLGMPSEREAHVVANGGRMYRSLYRKL